MGCDAVNKLDEMRDHRCRLAYKRLEPLGAVWDSGGHVQYSTVSICRRQQLETGRFGGRSAGGSRTGLVMSAGAVPSTLSTATHYCTIQ